MAALSVQCPKCQTPLLENAINSFGLAPCPGCQNLLQLEIFPALFRQNAPAQAGEGLLVEGESTCFYHSGKKAVLPCQGCGRFLCALCDCELNGEHFCPACLETGRPKGKSKTWKIGGRCTIALRCRLRSCPSSFSFSGFLRL